LVVGCRQFGAEDNISRTTPETPAAVMKSPILKGLNNTSMVPAEKLLSESFSARPMAGRRRRSPLKRTWCQPQLVQAGEDHDDDQSVEDDCRRNLTSVGSTLLPSRSRTTSLVNQVGHQRPRKE